MMPFSCTRRLLEKIQIQKRSMFYSRSSGSTPPHTPKPPPLPLPTPPLDQVPSTCLIPLEVVLRESGVEGDDAGTAGWAGVGGGGGSDWGRCQRRGASRWMAPAGRAAAMARSYDPGGNSAPLASAGRVVLDAAAAATDTDERAGVWIGGGADDWEARGAPAPMPARALAKSVCIVGGRAAEACHSGRCQGPRIHRSCSSMPCLTVAVFFRAFAAGPAAAAVSWCVRLMRSAVTASCIALSVL
jgi:hypothetical protein